MPEQWASCSTAHATACRAERSQCQLNCTVLFHFYCDSTNPSSNGYNALLEAALISILRAVAEFAIAVEN